MWVWEWDYTCIIQFPSGRLCGGQLAVSVLCPSDNQGNGLIRSTWDQWSSNSETGTLTVPLGTYPCISNVCQDQILSGHDLNTVYQMKSSSAYWNKLEAPWQWHVCQYARPRGATTPFPHPCETLPRHSPRSLLPPLQLHHTLCSDNVLLEHRQVHRFAVWTFTCPSWPGIRSGNYPWFPSVAQTWTTKYCEVWGCLTQWPRSTKARSLSDSNKSVNS